ncbi:MAG: hypothetical protein ABW185_00155 [Sedimenticola sp.]
MAAHNLRAICTSPVEGVCGRDAAVKPPWMGYVQDVWYAASAWIRRSGAGVPRQGEHKP